MENDQEKPTVSSPTCTALLCDDKIGEYKRNGWVFDYCDSTKFISAKHPDGGKQSICEIVNRFNNASFGFAIAKFLNE